MTESRQTFFGRLIDHLVGLSSLRRRDNLLSSITQALLETLEAQQVDIFSLVMDEDKRFLLPLTQALPGSAVRFVSDPLRTEPDAMLPVDSDPERLRCLDRVEIVATNPGVASGGNLTRFPITLAAGTALWGVAEIHSGHALDETEVMAVTRLLGMYGNLLDLLDYSECDALTGLWNRKPFDDLFYKAMQVVESSEPLPTGLEQRTTPASSNFWLAMVDIDHFKQVNDNFGHLIGDEVLILVARLLKNSFRACDRVYRFGGEEFVVVLRSADHDAAVAAVERFRTSMAQHDFPQAGRITASVGLTEILTGDSPSAACERADQAVYYAKHHGRNQVCSEPDLVRRGLLKAEVKVGDIELF